jgi:hypothetical protein
MQWNDSGVTFEQPPIGPHKAVLIRIIDIGTQTGEWKGQPTIRRQNLLTWELPYELREDGQPFVISKFYTASVGEKSNLTKDLTSWLGKPPTKPFDPKSILGKACQIIVTEKENSEKRIVSTVVGLAKGDTVPDKTHNPLVFFSLDDYDDAVFDGLTDGVQKMIMKSPEYAAIIGAEIEQPVKAKDDIPF